MLASEFRPKIWSISLLVLLFGTSGVYLCTKQKDSAMLTALSSVVQFVLEVIILFGLVGILVAQYHGSPGTDSRHRASCRRKHNRPCFGTAEYQIPSPPDRGEGTSYKRLKEANLWLRDNKLVNKAQRTYTILIPEE